MEHLIEEALHVEIRSFYDKEWYFKAVHLLTNGNPRSIKRLANAFLLTDKVAESKGMYQETSEETGWRKKILFLLSGIQLNYPEVYTHMAFSSSYGFFFRLFTVPEDSRVSMQKVLEELKLIQDFLWKERILDVFLLLASTLQAYTKSGLGLNIYPFMRICDFCRIVDMNMEEPWEQPESDENLYIDESGEMLEITDPHGMYLYDRMDRVLSFHFEKEDVNAWDWTAVDYDYRYSLKVPTDWFFGIRFWGNEVFPSVYLNKEILEKEKTWGEEIQRLQRNLAFWYERLQDTFGKKAYQDKDFTGTEFLVYSKEQADCLVEDLLEIFSGEYTKEND